MFLLFVDVVEELCLVVIEVVMVVGLLYGVVVLLLIMFGGEGFCDYVFVMQNNVELCFFGGIVGLIVLLYVENGQIMLQFQVLMLDFLFLEILLLLSELMVVLFEDCLGCYLQNIISIFDFSEVGVIIVV